MLHSKKITKITKMYIKYKLSMWKTKTRISKQKRVCLILGRNRSVYPKINLKRHTIKKVNATCLITGLSMGKW
jgi:ribosomal protein S14